MHTFTYVCAHLQTHFSAMAAGAGADADADAAIAVWTAAGAGGRWLSHP